MGIDGDIIQPGALENKQTLDSGWCSGAVRWSNGHPAMKIRKSCIFSYGHDTYTIYFSSFLGRKANMNIAASWAQQFLMMMRSDSTWLWPFELCPPKLKMHQRLSASWTVVNFLVLMAECPWREDEVHTRFTLTMQPPDITTIRNDLLNGSMFGGWRIWLWVKTLGPYLS